ncbi:MAG: SurA N-terminal domain-containing protein [Spirochaetales bacterium]|nr:SurA N-terminal domain-containing protein [Spirochaetales bacterium]
MSQDGKKVSNIKSAVNDKQRKYQKKQQNMMVGTIIILVIVVVSFVLVPALSGTGSGGAGSFVFGKYGNQQITFQQGNYFAQQVESVNNMYRDSLGNNSNVDFLRQLIWRSAFNQTVVRTAILDETTEAGVGVSSSGIDRAIVESGIFTNNGSFDEEAYLSASGTRIKEIRKSLEEDMKVQTFYSDVIYNQQRSQAMIDFLLDMGETEKNFAYARLNYSSFPQEKVVDYAKGNENLFSKITLNRITVRSSENDANAVLQKLESGEQSFADLAKTYSTDAYAENGGFMGETYKYTLLGFLTEDQASSVMSLSAGQHSELIASGSGWYIFQAEESASAPDFNSTETVAAIRSYMEREEVGLIEDYLMTMAQELPLAAHNTSFAEAAAAMGAESGETGFIAPVYGSVPFLVNSPGNKTSDSLLSAAAYSDEFFEKAFVLTTPGETSQPMILDRSVVVFSLIGEQEGFKYPEEYEMYIRSQLTNELSQYKMGELQSVFLSSPKFKDNFNKTYSGLFES